VVTIEGRDVVLVYFFLEEELSEAEDSLGVLIDGPVVDALLDGLQLVLVTHVPMQMCLRCAVLVGLQPIEDGGVGVGESLQRQLHLS
jgi:hypothetical protein